VVSSSSTHHSCEISSESSKSRGSPLVVMLISNSLGLSDSSLSSNSKESFKVVGGTAETRISSMASLDELNSGGRSGARDRGGHSLVLGWERHGTIQVRPSKIRELKIIIKPNFRFRRS